MKDELSVRAAKRTYFERFIKDPFVGLVIIFLWYFFKLLPLDIASALGGLLGRSFKYVMPKKQKVALYNLQKCFPEKSKAEHKEIVRKMWIHFGRMAGEMPHANKMLKRIKVYGSEYMEQLKNDGKGGFLASGHIGNWEFAGPLTTLSGMPLHLVYRAANNPWIERFIFQNRNLGGVQLIPKGAAGAKKMIELLKSGEHIGILCDQKLREGIDVPFFGYLAKTAPAVATLALKFNLPILPARVVRDKGANYSCYYYKPLVLSNSVDKNADIYEIMCQINKILEDWIRERPEQWLWIHHRWDKSEYPK